MSEERQDKNQIFNQANVPVPPQRQSAIDFDVPVDAVPLPSKGKVYPQGHPFHMQDRVEITAMTAKEEDILTSSALIKKGTVVTELIKSCLVDKSVDTGSLLTGDRNALMVAIRITGYGAEYEGEVTCESCGKATKREFDLGKLEIKPLELDPVTPNENVFAFRLPKTNKVVHFQFITGRIEEEVSVVNERQKKAYGHQKDTFVTTNLLYSILSVDGVTDRGKIAKFVANMPASDSQALRKYMRDNEPGMVMRQESECEVCGHLEETSLPISAEFFWPGASG